MPNVARQVQHPKSRAELERWLRKKLGDESYRSIRAYPGEDQGNDLAGYLNRFPQTGRKLSQFMEALLVLMELGEARRKHDVAAVDRLRRKQKHGLMFALDYLGSAARRGSKPTGVSEQGLIIAPSSSEGCAALAALVLEETGRIGRVKQCLYCRSWFYARFKHQQFCNDPKEKCQWSHYHSPEWRKRNRERNQRHQAEYRKRTFKKLPSERT